MRAKKLSCVVLEDCGLLVMSPEGPGLEGKGVP